MGTMMGTQESKEGNHDRIRTLGILLLCLATSVCSLTCYRGDYCGNGGMLSECDNETCDPNLQNVQCGRAKKLDKIVVAPVHLEGCVDMVDAKIDLNRKNTCWNATRDGYKQTFCLCSDDFCNGNDNPFSGVGKIDVDVVTYVLSGLICVIVVFVK